MSILRLHSSFYHKFQVEIYTKTHKIIAIRIHNNKEINHFQVTMELEIVLVINMKVKQTKAIPIMNLILKEDKGDQKFLHYRIRSINNLLKIKTSLIC